MTGIPVYDLTIPVLTRQLNNLSGILRKAEDWSGARKIAPEVLLGYRLAPDMFPLVRQVQLTTDFAKGAASRLAGREVPRYEDVETSFADLQARIAKTRDHLASFAEGDFAGAAERKVELKIGGETVAFDGKTYLLNFVYPNFYFHYATAYDILRHVGLDIGKRDFVGQR
ncbi:MAG: DUF1993 domain-containing protein [Hyphomicrobiales bacterium]